MPLPLQIALLALTGTAAITDARSRRIPNGLVVAGFAAGLALNTWLAGWGGVQQSLMGFGLAALIYIPLFILRAMSGGDVKLMAAAGSIVGPRDWFTLFILASIAGGAIALGMLLTRRALGPAFGNVMHILKELVHFRAPYKSNAALDVTSPKALTMPHGVAIAAGAVALLWTLH
ncbi:MAG TPA: A24 family peptidase [Bryobacteraceae bacterium]|nr:A24 family peptidase [Bryobacteraceae bacterium]